MTMATTDPTDEQLQRDRQVDRVLGEMTRSGQDESTEVDIHPDRTRESRTPGFSRMRTDWNSPEAAHVRSLNNLITRRLMTRFADAYELMNDIWLVVRTPVVDDNGEISTDEYGQPLWVRTEAGNYVEDWDKLGLRQREHFLFSIVTRLYEWQQTAGEAWAESMFAKAMWEERFAEGFGLSEGRTVDDRTHSGTRHSQQERYFAIFQASYSRRADALMNSLKGIELRLSQSVA